jgi:hypothetical protein
MKKASTRPQEI